MKRTAAAWTCMACLFTLGSGLGSWAEGPNEAPAPTSRSWDAATLRLVASLPLQDGGRIKPLATYAGFKLRQLNGMRGCVNLAGERLSPVEWLLDCLFFPEMAEQYKVFRIDNSDVLVALGLPFDKKRDRYSYRGLLPARYKLFELASQYANLPAQQRTAAQNQLVNLAHNMRDFETLTGQLGFARRTFSRETLQGLAPLFSDQAEYRVSDILQQAPQVFMRMLSMQGGSSHEDEKGKGKAGREAAVQLVRALHQLASPAMGGLAIFPPAATDESDWLTPAEAISAAMASESPLSDYVALVASLEELYRSRGDAGRFGELMAAFHTTITERARARGEYGKIDLEIAYYRADLFYWSLCLYVLSFLVVAASWLKPTSRFLALMGFAAVLAPTILLFCGIAMRCVIRGRPPVTTLYETILFVTAVAVAVSLVVEVTNRRKFGVALGSILGALGLFLAGKYEVADGGDTMPSMVAVLDTNFWLATHVTTITIGYAAGLLAGAMAHVYALGKFAGFRKQDPDFYHDLSRVVYGVFCFSLVFSIAGTVLGGIWANESWGRFWGWDPKENGALMIVLWQLAVIHARTGGYIRDPGVNLAAIFGGVIVAFSWFGVNLLGVGLHSYGFTTGISKALMVFYIVETAVLLLGSAVWIWEEGLRMPPSEGDASR